MTETLTKLTVLTEDLKVGDRAIRGEAEYIILSIEKSEVRDFKLKVAAPKSQFLKAPHSLYAWANDKWIKPIDTKLYDYLQDYNKRCPPLKQLTLAENDARIKSFENRDWWGNELTSPDAQEHLWNLYQREESLNYKHFYLKMYAKSKGVKLPEYDRDTLGFPLFTEEQIKQLESIHE